MNKAELRKLYKLKRQLLSPEDIEQKSLDIANQALKLDIWQYTYYHLFLSITHQNEVNTEFLMHIIQGKDKQIVLGKSNFINHTLQHFLLTDSTLIKTNQFGIPEPQDGIQVNEEKLDVIFIPLLAYDEKGNRIGYGKGFYDRFLKSCKRDVIKIGLSFFNPFKNIETEKHDVTLDYCITPQEVFKF